jgi:serine/threonine-protein kinase RsbW
MPEPPVAFAGVGPDAVSYSQVDDLAAVRGFVRARAQALGLAPERAGRLLIAISELVTNTLLHTTGGGRVRVFAEPGFVVCDVVDGGRPREFGREMPSADAVSGRGLAIVERICDEVSTAAVPDGTLVRLRLRR